MMPVRFFVGVSRNFGLIFGGVPQVLFLQSLQTVDNSILCLWEQNYQMSIFQLFTGIRKARLCFEAKQQSVDLYEEENQLCSVLT